jgi:hypothetical protein
MFVRPHIIEIRDVISGGAVMPGASWCYSRHMAEPLFLKLSFITFLYDATLAVTAVVTARPVSHTAPRLWTSALIMREITAHNGLRRLLRRCQYSFEMWDG